MSKVTSDGIYKSLDFDVKMRLGMGDNETDGSVLY